VRLAARRGGSRSSLPAGDGARVLQRGAVDRLEERHLAAKARRFELRCGVFAPIAAPGEIDAVGRVDLDAAIDQPGRAIEAEGVGEVVAGHESVDRRADPWRVDILMAGDQAAGLHLGPPGGEVLAGRLVGVARVDEDEVERLVGEVRGRLGARAPVRGQSTEQAGAVQVGGEIGPEVAMADVIVAGEGVDDVEANIEPGLGEALGHVAGRAPLVGADLDETRRFAGAAAAQRQLIDVVEVEPSLDRLVGARHRQPLGHALRVIAKRSRRGRRWRRWPVRRRSSRRPGNPARACRRSSRRPAGSSRRTSCRSRR
jgi:hypothetical protein